MRSYGRSMQPRVPWRRGSVPRSLCVTAFADHLNDWGLFASRDNAEELRVNCDARVTSHAPFFVFGLWTSIGLETRWPTPLEL